MSTKQTTINPAAIAADAASEAHNFLYRLNALMNDGASSDEIWNHCINNGKQAKKNLAVALNYYEGRTGARELSTT